MRPAITSWRTWRGICAGGRPLSPRPCQWRCSRPTCACSGFLSGGKRKIVVEKFSQQLHFVCVKWPKAGFHAISLRKRLEKRAYVNASGSSLWECTVNNLLEVYFHHALGQSVPARYYSTFSGNPLRLSCCLSGFLLQSFSDHFPVSEFFNSHRL